jgi:phage-related protein|tara:strand:+ start:224 stop:574 length:351 start_codon:yes stop_codon:yes gene_type:complete
MATFPNIEPSFTVRKISKPRTRTVKFGDGYEHRLLFGLNQNPKIFNFTWKNISETDSDTIETFLDARAVDSDSFTYTPHNEPSAMEFKCTDWSKSMEFPNRATIQATFTQVFEPIS